MRDRKAMPINGRKEGVCHTLRHQPMAEKEWLCHQMEKEKAYANLWMKIITHPAFLDTTNGFAPLNITR